MLYFVCICSASLFAVVAQKRNNKVFLFVSALILSLFCGLRGLHVGIDTKNYIIYLENLQELGIEFGSDIGFSTISYLLLQFIENYYFVLLIYSFFTNYLIIFRLWDFRDRASLPLMVVIYAVIHYPYAFNIVRQFFAIAIVFWGTRYIEKNQTWKYILLNLLAASIHTSSLICFSYLILKQSANEKHNSYRYLKYFVAIAFVVVGLGVFQTNARKYKQYFQMAEFSLHMVTIIRLICALVVVVFNRVLINPYFSMTRQGEPVSLNCDIVYSYLIGLLVASLGMFFSFMNRLGFYFLIFELPFWGQAVRAKRNRGIFRLMISAIIVYMSFAKLLWDTEGIIHYATFFTDWRY